MTFSDFRSSSQPLFLKLKILKIPDIVKLQNLLLTFDILTSKSPVDIAKTLDLNSYNDIHTTRGKSLCLLTRPICRTTTYGLNSVSYQFVIDWNELQLHYKETNLCLRSRPVFKKMAFDYLLDKYSI